MRITLVIFALVAGGAERVIATMANYWAEKGWAVNLLTFDSGAVAPFYKLHAAVRHQHLSLARVSRNPVQAIVNNVRRVRKLRAAIRETKPDALISLMSETNVLTLLATAGLRIPVFVQEQIDPHEHPIGRGWNILRFLTYPRATHVVALNDRSLRYFSPSVRKRGRIIPNFASVPSAPQNTFSKNGSQKTVMAMGRLVPQKGFDLLIEAFVKIAPSLPQWSLEIMGEGAMRGDLESLAERLGIRERVRFPGVTKEPHEALRRADLFVLSSRYEGFPLALCEAMACGLPAISFACSSGPGEIIRDGIDGVLVPAGNPDALAAAMKRLMGDGAERRRLAERAPEVLERFGVEKIMGMWEELLRGAMRAAS